MKKIRIFVILLLALLIVGCSGDSDESNNYNEDYELSMVDIRNAESLFITEGSSLVEGSSLLNVSADGEDETERLFKITEDGYIEEVRYYNEEGNEIDNIRETPVNVYNVNSEYVIVLFGSDDVNIESGYLVEKDSGAVFDLSNIGFPKEPYNYFNNTSNIQTDDLGNIYYLSWESSGSSASTSGNKIVKINTSNMNGEVLSPEHHYLEYFVVDDVGNIVYYARDEDWNWFSRIQKASGGQEYFEHKNFWSGLDNKVYYLEKENSQIKKILFSDSGDINFKDYGNEISSFRVTDSYKLEVEDKVFIASGDSVYEVYNKADSPKEIEGIDISDIRIADSSNNYYYLFDDVGKLNKINPNTNSITTILDGEYDIYEMGVSKDDKIIFNALRMDDTAIVIGEMDSSGEINIINENMQNQVVDLERIN